MKLSIQAASAEELLAKWPEVSARIETNLAKALGGGRAPPDSRVYVPDRAVYSGVQGPNKQMGSPERQIYRNDPAQMRAAIDVGTPVQVQYRELDIDDLSVVVEQEPAPKRPKPVTGEEGLKATDPEERYEQIRDARADADRRAGLFADSDRGDPSRLSDPATRERYYVKER